MAFKERPDKHSRFKQSLQIKTAEYSIVNNSYDLSYARVNLISDKSKCRYSRTSVYYILLRIRYCTYCSYMLCVNLLRGILACLLVCDAQSVSVKGDAPTTSLRRGSVHPQEQGAVRWQTTC